MKGTYFNINYEFEIEDVWKRIDVAIEKKVCGYICVADGNILSMVHKDLSYRNTVNNAIFSICDSSWVPIYINLLYGFKPQQYSGSQIFDDVTRMKRYRMYFLGSSQKVLDALREKMGEVDANILDMTFKELPFCNVEDFNYKDIAADINADNPDIIWVALGAPKQEYFASLLVPYLKRGVVIPVGAVFNFRSGLRIKRAPRWMVKMHMEFVYRVFSEPYKQIRRCYNIISSLPDIIITEKQRKSCAHKEK